MKLHVAAVATGSLLCSIAAFAQTSPTTTPAPAPQAQTGSKAAAPAAGGKRQTCQSAAQALKGQEKRDQMQLCLAEGHLDCLKQAIDQKITGPQRRDFIKSCMG